MVSAKVARASAIIGGAAQRPASLPSAINTVCVSAGRKGRCVMVGMSSHAAYDQAKVGISQHSNCTHESAHHVSATVSSDQLTVQPRLHCSVVMSW